jgi:hypothetical protein
MLSLRKMMRIIILSIVFVTLLGCASTQDEFVFDGSSEESIQNSISDMLMKLPERKRMEFASALLAIQFSDVKSVFDVLGDPAMESINYNILSKKLDGLTYRQAMALAKKSPTTVKQGISAN